MTEQESKIEKVNAELTEIEGTFVDIAKKKISLLKAKMTELDRLLMERDAVIHETQVLEDLLQTAEPRVSKQLESTARSNVVAGEFADLYVWQAVEIILGREERELSTREIVDRLEAGGKILNKSNPASQVYTSINPKRKTFYGETKSGRRLWGLLKWRDATTQSMFDENK